MDEGCIVGPDLAVMSLVLVKKGAEEIPGGALGDTFKGVSDAFANSRGF